METGLTLGIHGVTLTMVVGIFVMLLSQHKIWIRMKDRLNTLWKDRCKEHGEYFVSLDGNGK